MLTRLDMDIKWHVSLESEKYLLSASVDVWSRATEISWTRSPEWILPLSMFDIIFDLSKWFACCSSELSYCIFDLIFKLVINVFHCFYTDQLSYLSAQTEWRREGVTLANIVDWYCAGHNGEDDDVDHDDDHWWSWNQFGYWSLFP